MNIGIDIDNVISNFNEVLLNEFLIHDKDLRNSGIINANADYITRGMFDWSKEELDEFYMNNIERIAKKLVLLDGTKEYIDKLKNAGYNIFIITGRDNGEYTNPYEMTKKWLDKNNIIYDVEYNKKTYSIENNGEIIDMATLENGVTIKVIPGNKYNEMKGYNSILEKLGRVIPAGISYAESLEKTNPTDMDKYKKEFIMTIEEFINTQQSGLTQNNQAEQQPNLTENNENNQIYPEY